MSNTYFSFKQFTIHQDKCAMKVSTDACIQGAWTPVPQGEKRMLDIGAGTGLLSLMQVQKNNNLKIDAIEADAAAAEQASANVAASPWPENINIICADAIAYNYQHQYDLIISNPPFFNNSLLGPLVQRNNARHTITLTYNSLFDIISNNLTPGGIASVLLPIGSMSQWEQLLFANNWQVCKKLLVHPRVGQAPNRVVLLCAPGTGLQVEEEHLSIRGEGDVYTAQFTTLMQPYYLDR